MLRGQPDRQRAGADRRAPPPGRSSSGTATGSSGPRPRRPPWRPAWRICAAPPAASWSTSPTTRRIDLLNAQADLTDNKACVYAKNLVASGIRDIVRSYSNPNLKYVVLVGGDSSVPFFRYPDPADLAPESWFIPPVGPGTPSEAAIKSEYVLGQDEYGASTILNLGGTRFPVPEQAVGRLVETAKRSQGGARRLPRRHRRLDDPQDRDPDNLARDRL